MSFLTKSLGPKISLDVVYYVSCTTDNTVLIAFQVEFGGKFLRWLDTVKERMMDVESIVGDGLSGFSFVRTAREGGGLYVFTPMTIDIYRNHVRQRLVRRVDFSDQESLWKAIRKTKETMW